jgi:hypothetical protein
MAILLDAAMRGFRDHDLTQTILLSFSLRRQYFAIKRRLRRASPPNRRRSRAIYMNAPHLREFFVRSAVGKLFRRAVGLRDAGLAQRAGAIDPAVAWLDQQRSYPVFTKSSGWRLYHMERTIDGGKDTNPNLIGAGRQFME